MRQRIMLAAALALALGALVPMALAQEWSPMRSSLISAKAVATNYSIKLTEYNVLAAEAEAKYGPGARSTLDTSTGKVETTVDGKVVATTTLRSQVEEVFGIFLVGPRRSELARFPFMLMMNKQGERGDVGKMVRGRFEQKAAELFGFSDFDWATLWCWQPETSAVGEQLADGGMRLGKADLCLVRWRVGKPKVMLIGGIATDGGEWGRRLAVPTCRSLVAEWIEQPGRSAPDYPVDYAACVLVHQPDRGVEGARNTVVEHMFEVRAGGEPALIE